jgi:hypothetical protein
MVAPFGGDHRFVYSQIGATGLRGVLSGAKLAEVNKALKMALDLT